jgi:hypothetical protein
MKTHFGIWIAALLLINPSFLGEAQNAGSQPTQVQTVNAPAPTPYAITVQDGGSRVWQQTTYEVDPSGRVFSRQHSYTELASGLNHLVNGQWVESSEQIDIQPNGTAQAVNGQHQAYFPGDIYQGEIELVTPDGVQLHSRPMGLSYFDGTNSVMIAELTNSIGVVSGANQVIYPNAFTDFKADLVYTYTKAGFEQDIVLREQPPTPESFGLNSQNTRLQVLTEFFDTADPGQTALAVNPQDGLSDTSLTFGQMKMIQGKAFAVGDTDQAGPPSKTPVYKSWQILDGRTFLVEELPVQSITTQLEQLPVPASANVTVSSANPGLHKVSATRRLSPSRLAQTSTNTMQLAQAGSTKKLGLVLDYVIVDTSDGDAYNYTFQGDTTYYLSGQFFIDSTMTLEGGAVIKFAPTNSPYIDLYALNCQTSPYRPAVFTSRDDNSVGETISGSTGSPAPIAGVALICDLSPSNNIQNIRFAYISQGVEFSGSAPGAVRDCQFVNVADPIANWSDFSPTFVENVLFDNVSDYVLSGGSSYPIRAANLTVHAASHLISGSPLSVTNSLFICVTNWGGTFTSAYNATNMSDSGVFQTVGAGSHYLANNSPYRNVGTTNIDPILLADIRTKTTYPPLIYSNVTISAATILNPQAQRDTDTPDLGYHYDPIDYAIGGVDLYNSLNVASGTVVSWFESQGGVSSSGQGYGISLNDGASLSFQGTATLPCWMVRYDTVQEGSWGGKGWMGGVMINGSSSGVHPRYNAQFTKLSGLSQDSNHYRDNWAYGTSAFADCEFYISGIAAYDQSSVTFTNCLFFRVGVYFDGYIQPNIPSATFQNCLFYNGFLTMNRYTGQPVTTWTIQDTAFDGTGFSFTDNYNGNPTETAFDYNAYNTNNQSGLAYPYPYTPVPTNRLENLGAHDVFTGTYNWQDSWLGNYYQPTNSPLIDKGNPTADQLGLYHFTTQTNQTVEGTSTVDIGYHYVATDTNGIPLDTNGDGVPDYLEDANGNGLVDSGETGWNLTGDLGLKVLITRPRNGSLLP